MDRNHTIEFAKLAQELYFCYEKLPPTKQLAAKILDRYINYIDPLCENDYARLAIFSTTSASIVDRFIARIATRWQAGKLLVI
ncbi:hypothetical protein [Chamaesiphon polymorphus]|uniref:Uncharacterized protein n=1 Tax=Chamaesiphon polymorphus CCALA 037 TaxID=2107692 RepID=A0A2T1GLE9_9CYAN|nr:hypothetical protein [Chamaesiphon polymorphus]PSB58630.1 hypothetical protein C7B77_03935 [Chamaesiphon polymorphus CCALA 037]